MPGVAIRSQAWPREQFGPAVGGKTIRPMSYRSSSLNVALRKRTLDEFPMEHRWADTARLSATRRQEKARFKRNVASTHGESQQLSSYGRKRFETALTVSGTSLPPLSPEDKNIFWDDVKPSWSHRRHHSVADPLGGSPASSPAAKATARPGSEPTGSVAARQQQQQQQQPKEQQRKDNALIFNHLRGANDMYPVIKRLLQESNAEYRVVSTAIPDPAADSSRSQRRQSVDHSVVITDCFLVPLKEDDPPSEQDVQSQPEVVDRVPPENLEETAGAEDRRSEDFREPDPRLPASPVNGYVPDKDEEEEEEEEEEADEPEGPWRCWVDDATVSSLALDKEPEVPADDSPTAAPSPAPEAVPDVATQPPVADAISKGRLSALGKQAKASSATVDKLRESAAASPAPEVPVAKRKSSTKTRKKKGRKGTPEPPPPVEVVELPPPPPPAPPTPPIEEVTADEAKAEEEAELEPHLPSYICPSSIAKSTEAEIKLWLRKSSFTNARRTLPIF